MRSFYISSHLFALSISNVSGELLKKQPDDNNKDRAISQQEETLSDSQDKASSSEWKKVLQPLSSYEQDTRPSEIRLLGRKTLTHQVSTLLAWHAYAIYKALKDTASNVLGRYNSQWSISYENPALKIKELCKTALEIRPEQSLATFVQAQLDQDQDFTGHAADKFQHLLDALGYFDPFLYSAQYIADWEALRSTYEQSGRSLDYMGLITGQRQYETIISKAHVHAALAEVYARQNKPRQSILQIQSAIVWSPYLDLDAHYFMLLARYLDKIEQLEDALAAVQEVKNRLEKINHRNPVLWDEPRLFETMVYSRLSRQDRAIEIAGKLIDWHDYETSIALLKQTYSAGMAEILDTLIREIEGKLNQPYQFKDVLFELASSARNPEKLTKKFKGLMDKISDQDKLLPQIEISQFLDSITWDAFTLIIQRGKILNNIAYAYSKDNVWLEKALCNAREALYLVLRLKRSTRGTIEIQYSWDETEAFKLDTLGWIYFRKQNIGCALVRLLRACDLIPNDADIHYHLARVYTEKLQIAWQNEPDVKKKQGMPDDLRHALRHWHEAKRNDSNGRLFGDLARLRERIQRYEASWQVKLFPETAKKEKASDKND